MYDGPNLNLYFARSGHRFTIDGALNLPARTVHDLMVRAEICLGGLHCVVIGVAFAGARAAFAAVHAFPTSPETARILFDVDLVVHPVQFDVLGM